MLSSSYPELKHLSRLLTGQYPPSTTCLTWTTSSNVDVFVLDITSSQEKPNIEHIRNIEGLKRAVDREIPTDVSLRLFLVEDMSASVVEVLGAAFGCYPHLFENHMRTIGGRPQQRIDENGAPLPITPTEIPYTYPGLPGSSSELRDQPYFSVTFRQNFRYASGQDREVHLRRRTMFRSYHQGEHVLEERVSGALHSTSAGTSKIGKSYP